MPFKWPENWFANKGQLSQFALGVLGFGLACIVAWPTLQANQLLAPGSLLYFVVAALVIGFSVRIIPVLKSQNHARKYEKDELSRSQVFVHKVTCRVGDFWEEPDSLRPLKLTVRKVVNEPKLGVEVEVSGQGLGLRIGRDVAELDSDVYLLPISKEYSNEHSSLFYFNFSEGFASFTAVRIEHANLHSQAVLLLICRVR